MGSSYRVSCGSRRLAWRCGAAPARPSVPLLLPVGLYRLNWFYPAMMILVGAHYLPFVFLYGMRLFAALAAVLVGGGTLIAMYFSDSFSIGAWYTGTILLVFAELGRRIANHEYRANAPAA
jgi:hypothetical protein